MAWKPFPWFNKGEVEKTKLNRQNLNAAEEVIVAGIGDGEIPLPAGTVFRSGLPVIYASWFGMNHTATGAKNSEALQEALNEAKNTSIFSSGRGGCIMLPPGICELASEVHDEGLATVIRGGSAYSCGLKATTEFTGENMIKFKQNVAGASLNISHGIEDVIFYLNGQSCHGTTLYKGYDYIYWKNVGFREVADAYSAYRCLPDPSIENKVSQTFVFENVYSVHQNATATAPTAVFEFCQEINLIGCKSWGGNGNVAMTATATPYSFVDCRGVNMLGCSSVDTAAGAITLSTKNQPSIGVNIQGHTFEGVTKALVVEGTEANKIQEVTLGALRIQGTVGGMELAYCTHSDIWTRALPVTVAATCEQIHIYTENAEEITSSGKNISITGFANAGTGGTEMRFSPRIAISAVSSPETRWRVPGLARNYGLIFSGNNTEGGHDFGFSVRSYATTEGSIETLMTFLRGSPTQHFLDFAIGTVGKGFRVKEGTNAKQGVSAAMVAGKATVANTSVTANSRIHLTRQGGGTHAGGAFVVTQTAGEGFTLESTNKEDTGTVAYQIFEPA